MDGRYIFHFIELEFTSTDKILKISQSQHPLQLLETEYQSVRENQILSSIHSHNSCLSIVTFQNLSIFRTLSCFNSNCLKLHIKFCQKHLWHFNNPCQTNLNRTCQYAISTNCSGFRTFRCDSFWLLCHIVSRNLFDFPFWTSNPLFSIDVCSLTNVSTIKISPEKTITQKTKIHLTKSYGIWKCGKPLSFLKIFNLYFKSQK